MVVKRALNEANKTRPGCEGFQLKSAKGKQTVIAM